MFKIISLGLFALVAVCHAGVYQTELSGLPVSGAKILNGALSSGYVSGAALPAVGGSYYSNPVAVSSGAIGGSYYSSPVAVSSGALGGSYYSSGAVAVPSAGAVAYPSAGAVAVPAVGAVGVGAVGVPAAGAVGVGGVQNIYAEHAHVEPGQEIVYKVRSSPQVQKHVALVGQVVNQPKYLISQPKVEVLRQVVPPQAVDHVTVVQEPKPHVTNVIPQVHTETVVVDTPKAKPQIFLSQRRRKSYAKKIDIDQHKITHHSGTGEITVGDIKRYLDGGKLDGVVQPNVVVQTGAPVAGIAYTGAVAPVAGVAYTGAVAPVAYTSAVAPVAGVAYTGAVAPAAGISYSNAAAPAVEVSYGATPAAGISYSGAAAPAAEVSYGATPAAGASYGAAPASGASYGAAPAAGASYNGAAAPATGTVEYSNAAPLSGDAVDANAAASGSSAVVPLTLTSSFNKNQNRAGTKY